MADLQKYIDYYSGLANNNYQSQYSSTNNDYDTQLNNLTNDYNNVLGQYKQTLAAIPGKYQPIRNSAYLANQKANLALPAQMANAGYSSQSGLAYDTQQNNNATWQKSVDTADQAQNTATQSQNNAINTLTNSYNSNLGTIRAKKAAALAAIDAAKNSWVNEQAQTAYNNELAQEAAIAKAQADAQAREYEASLRYSGGGSTEKSSSTTINEIRSAVKGLGGDGALNYLANNNLGDYAQYVPYSGVRFDENGTAHVLNSLDDYANAVANGWSATGYMYGSNGHAHRVASLNDYNNAISQGFFSK